jgi:hypothetical protein
MNSPTLTAGLAFAGPAFLARTVSALLCALMLVVAGAPARAQTQTGVSQQGALQRDLALFLSWFEGRFDNELQVFFEPDLNTPENARHDRIHSSFRRVDLPSFGAHVFYIEQFGDGDPGNIYRQRLYTISPDYPANAIRLDIRTPVDAEALRGAHRNPALIEGLTPEATISLHDGCAVYWRRQENQFIGQTRRGACRIQSRRSGRTIIVEDDLVLTEHAIWIQDRATDTRGRYVYGNRAGVAHQLRRVRPFECWIAVLRGARHGDLGENAAAQDWHFQRGVLLHDQGGVATVSTDESPARRITLKLRRVEWPSGANRPSLTLYVMEQGSERAVSYVWGEYDAERLGINLRWLQASCTHAPERLWDLP